MITYLLFSFVHQVTQLGQAILSSRTVWRHSDLLEPTGPSVTSNFRSRDPLIEEEVGVPVPYSIFW